MHMSVFGIIIVGVVSVTLLYVLVKGISVAMSLLKSMQAGQAKLTCPHCGQQTSHASGRCDACEREL